jgi:hypothetical protein
MDARRNPQHLRERRGREEQCDRRDERFGQTSAQGSIDREACQRKQRQQPKM